MTCELSDQDPTHHCFHWTGRGGFNGSRCAMEYERQCCRCGRMSLAMIGEDSTPLLPGHGPFAVLVGGSANDAEHIA